MKMSQSGASPLFLSSPSYRLFYSYIIFFFFIISTKGALSIAPPGDFHPIPSSCSLVLHPSQKCNNFHKGSQEARKFVKMSKKSKLAKLKIENGQKKDTFFQPAREARRLAQRAERPRRGFRPFGPAGVLRRRLLHRNGNFVPLAP